MSVILNNISKTYSVGEIQVKALEDVSFESNKGEIVCILGPSGSGKSTLLNLIGGLDDATSGSIIIDGQEITNISKKDLNEYRRNYLGFVFQSYSLLPNLTVFENVEVGSYLSDQTISVNDILKAVGIYEQRNKYPHQLSGGQQQRVAIARAIIKNPKLILCDEPTGALDEEMGKQVLTLLQDLNKQFGTDIYIVTHNLGVKDIADRVIKMKSGKVVEIIENQDKVAASEIKWV